MKTASTIILVVLIFLAVSAGMTKVALMQQDVLTFEDESPKTNLQLTWAPHDATDAEIACFADAVANMGKGWESGFAIMDEMFAELQAEKPQGVQ